MTADLALTGILPFVVLVGSALAVPVSLLLLGMYRRAVLRGMNRGGRGAADSSPPQPSRPPDRELRIVTHDLESRIAAPPGSRVYAAAIRGRWRTAAVYAAAGAAYAAVMTAGWTLAADERPSWLAVAVLYWSFLWPAVLAVSLVAAYDGRRRAQLFGAYALGFAALSAFAATDLQRAMEPTFLWLIVNAPATALVLPFLWRRIRAVAPLVAAFSVAIVLGSQLLLDVLSRSDARLRVVSDIGFDLGLGATEAFVALIVLGALALGLLVWPLLRLVGRLYKARVVSDQMIMLDALCFVYGIVQAILLAFAGAAWILVGPAAFVAFKAVSTLGFRLGAAARPTGRPTRLLLLRVFALGRRSERLFDRFRRHWQYVGPTSMIAGPDLATTTVEPYEFLEFVGGRLSRQFVADAQELDGRMRLLDDGAYPDPDGRYRVHEFFCHADTWQMTMARLAAGSDAVLMDLRSFSPANRGALYELGHLMDRVDLDRVVFLIDGTTDASFLETMLRDEWRMVDAGSPNRLKASPVAQFFRITSQSERELTALLRLLLRPAPLEQASAAPSAL